MHGKALIENTPRPTRLPRANALVPRGVGNQDVQIGITLDLI